MTSTTILGCRVDARSKAEALREILDAVAAARAGRGAPLFVATLGTEMLVRARRDARFRETIARAGLALCDTIGVLLASRLRGGPLRERVTGVDLVEEICAAGARDGISIFLLGALPATVSAAAERLREKYPGLRVAGAQDGYFSEDESDAIAARIRSTRADILFVGLGSPRQEYWIDRHLGPTGCPVGVGVGGSFDVISGRTSRAPRLWQAMGLEWLYRLGREPHRWRRQLALPYFVYLAAREAATAALPRRCARR